MKPSFLTTPDLAWKSPKKRKAEVNELTLLQACDKIFNINSVSTENSTYNCSYKRFVTSVQFYNSVSNEQTRVPAVHE